MPVRRTTTAALLLGLAGCAEMTSIYHSRPVKEDRPRVITYDAEQRSLVLMPHTDGWRLCSEAAPDAFSAQSGSASGSLGANLTAQTGSVQGGAALAETAATIERTQAYNLLRESMYRTCERWLSGALTKEQFIIQAARDQRTMTAVLAIEQLTRTARAPSTVLGPAGTSSSAGGEAGAKLAQDFADQKAAADKAARDAGTKYAAALKLGKCDTVTAAPAGDDGGADPTLTNWTACNTAKAEKTARDGEFKAASDRLDKVLEIARTSTPTGAQTSAGTNSAGGGGDGPSDAALIAVAQAVERIASVPSFDEALMFCVGYLSGREPDETESAVTTGCMDVVKSRAAQDEKRLEAFFGPDMAGAVRDGERGGKEYTQFEGELLSLIAGTRNDAIADTMAAFERAAGVPADLAPACVTTAACVDEVRQSRGYLQQWREHRKGLQRALTRWQTGALTR